MANMRKQSFAATITIIFCAIFVSVIGSTFVAFLQKKNIVEVKSIKISKASSIFVYNEDDNEIDEIKLSNMTLGLKPATGEEDEKTEIPSTITSNVGSEGYYAKFKVTSSGAYKIFVSDVTIQTKNGAEVPEKERKHIKVALEKVDNSTKDLSASTVVLTSVTERTDKKEYTILCWLDSKASEKLKGAKITFQINIK